MATRTILAVNAGSSSLKLALFDADEDPHAPVHPPRPPGGSPRELARETLGGLDERSRTTALDGIGDWCERHSRGAKLAAVGHRVVHGGANHAEPVVIDDAVLAELGALCALAPLHQAQSLAPIRSLRRLHPSLVQVACFDTAFHRGRRPADERYGLPQRFFEDGIRRYGFHGLSYEHVVSVLPSVAPSLAHARVIACHLGSGASLAAIRDGRSVDTTMGFSPLDGLVMGTRCGDLDPGVVLHLVREGRSVDDVERLLYRESGMLGISGLSADTRDLLASGSPAAREAIDTFVTSVVRAIGSLTAMLGGLDGIVFTAGIGEHSAEIRARIGSASAWTGLVLDQGANERGGPCVSAAESKVEAWVIPTDEERVIARHVRQVLG